MSRYGMRLALALMIALALVGGTAGAAGRLEPATVKEFGGIYRADCADAGSRSVIVREDHVVFADGGKRIAWSFLSDSERIDYFGRMMPDDFQTALMAEDANGYGIQIIVHRDARGPYLTVEGHPAIEETKDKPAVEFRLCDAASRPVPVPPPVVHAPRETVAAGEYPNSDAMIQDPAFRAAYHKALGRHAKLPWLAQMNSRAGSTTKVTVAGREYLQVNCCKEHDCGASNATVLYSAAKKRVYGKISLEGKSAMIGSPPPEIAKALGELWRKQWVHGR